MSNLSIGVNLAWQIAAGEAADKQTEFIEKEHILIGIFSLEKIFTAEGIKEKIGGDLKAFEIEYFALEDTIKSVGLNMTDLRRGLRNKVSRGNFAPRENVIHRSNDCKGYFERAQELGKGHVNLLTFLIAILERPGEIIGTVLKEYNCSPEKFKEKISKKMEGFKGMSYENKEVIKNKKDEDNLVWLLRYGRDLVKQAKEGKLTPIEGRRDEMLQLVRTLSRKTKNNPVLIGEAGVGKTAIVEGLAQRIANGKNLEGKRIIELSVSSLIAGTSYRGEFEKRLEEVIREAKENPEVILFLDEIHNLVGAGKVSDSSLDAANILKPALARGEIKCIGATTISEYRKYIEKDAALERRFQPVMVKEPTPEESVKILQILRPKFEEHHKTKIHDEALIKAVELSVRYLPYRQLPDKAVDIIDEACASVQVPTLSFTGLEEAKQNMDQGFGEVNEDKVAEVVSRLTGIPVSKLTEKDVDKLLNLENYLREKIRGQDEAIKIVANKIRMVKTGMRDKNKPLSVFLFLGPTGVGKTLFAKTIASVLFGSEKEMVRIDMSEYQEKHTVSKLLGAPPGYVGYEEEGQLTGKLRNKPYSVVLLDEIEKAHPEVLDVFLQLFDEGRLTDSKGRTIDAKNAIFVMTSNLPPENRMGFKVGATSIEEEETLGTVRKSFRPEFLNRIDKIIIFRHLGRDIVKEIVKQQLESFTEEMSKEQGVSISFSPQILELIAEVGYSERNGAREIQRAIDRVIKEPLSENILRLHGEGKEIKGSAVRIERQNDTLKIIWKGDDGDMPTQPPRED